MIALFGQLPKLDNSELWKKLKKKITKLNNFQLSSKRDGLVSSVQSNHVHWLRGESQEEFGGTGEILGNLVGGDVVAALNPS